LPWSGPTATTSTAAGRWLQEAGYFRGTDTQTSTLRDFLDAVDEERNRGNRRNAEGEEGATTKRERELLAEREAHEHDRHEQEYGQATADLIEAGYVGMHSDLHELAVKVMVDEHLSPDDAVEQAAMRLTAEDPVYGVTHDAIVDTYGEGAFDEIRAASASEDGEHAARQREEGARPGEAQEDRSDGTDVSDAGAESREADQEARTEVEAALGADAEHVAQADIARAAELMVDNPGMTPEVAFGHAVIETAVDQGYITEQQAEQAYGPEVKAVLESGSEGPSGSSGAVEQGGAEPDQVGTGGPAQAGELPRRGKTRRKGKVAGVTAPAADEAAAAADATKQPAAGRKSAAGDKAGNAAANKPAAETPYDAEQSVDSYIADIERWIANEEYNATIAPTRSVDEFKAAAEARGWTYGPYGKGKALWSADRKHVMFFGAPVEGNHLNVQWGEPSEGIVPPGDTDAGGPR
jgi:hypothetical protein